MACLSDYRPLIWILLVLLCFAISGCSSLRWAGFNWEQIFYETAKSEAQSNCRANVNTDEYFECMGMKRPD